MRFILSLFLLIASVTLGAHPPDPHLVLHGSPVHRVYSAVPPGKSLTVFKEKKEYLIGQVKVGKQKTDVTLSVRPERNEKREWVRPRYLLTFHSKENLGAEKASHVACTVNFYADEQNAIFKGILVHEKLRGQGLMKLFFKFFALFVDQYHLGIATEKMYKPMFAKLFTDFGFTPNSERMRVRISRIPGPNDSLQIYPYGFDLRPALIKSQNMNVLEEPPTEKFQDVYVNTEYLLAPSKVEAFWAQIANLKAEYTIYVAN